MIIDEPPNSINAEHSVISSLVKSNDLIDKIPFLMHEAFYQHSNGTIYRAIKVMLQHNKPVDIVTLADFLNTKKKLDDVGGISALTEIIMNAPMSSNIEHHARILMDKYLLRQLLAKTNEIHELVYSDGDVSKKIQSAQSIIMSITDGYISGDPHFISDLLNERMEVYDKRFSGEINPIHTGLKDLDTFLGGGVEPGDLVIVAGRPSMGKTALAVQIAQNIQKDDGACIVFTCEMPKEQIVDRVISGLGRINNKRIKTGKFEDEDWDKLTTAFGLAHNMNMMIDDSSYDLQTISSKCRNVKRKYGLSCIVIDYIGLLDGEGDSREQKISSLSRGFKKLAKELNIPVILLSQLNRTVENRANKRPVMSDLRESGAIEQDADLIIMVYRDEVYNPDSMDKGTAELIIPKYRSGEIGRVRVGYVGQHTKFEDYSGGQYFKDDYTDDNGL